MFLKKKISEPIKIILRNPGININDFKKQNTALDNIKEGLLYLKKNKLISIHEHKKEKKLYPNYYNEDAYTVYALIELENLLDIISTYEFVEKIRMDCRMFKQLLKNNLYSIILFGSITKKALDKDSDIDILVITNEKPREQESKKMLANIRNTSIKLNKDIQVVDTTVKNFKSQLYEPSSFANQVLKDHVILEGTTNFINLTKPG